MTALATINDRTTMMLNVAFYDEDDAAVTPDSATYRIDAPNEGVVILASTAITGLSTTVDLTITAAQNGCVSEAPFSERVITVTWVYAGGKQGTDEYRYRIKNLHGIVSASVSPSASASPSPSA